MKVLSLCIVAGFSNFCWKFSYQPCHWCLPWSNVWRQPGGGPSYSYSIVGYMFYPCCCTRVITRKDEACIMGSTHFLGTSRPLCGNVFNCLAKRKQSALRLLSENVTVGFMYLKLLCFGFICSLCSVLMEKRGSYCPS